MILIKFRLHRRFWKRKASLDIDVSDNPSGIFVPEAWTDADTVEAKASMGPMFAEKTRLRFSNSGQFVVVRLEKRSLRVTDKKKSPQISTQLFRQTL